MSTLGPAAAMGYLLSNTALLHADIQSYKQQLHRSLVSSARCRSALNTTTSDTCSDPFFFSRILSIKSTQDPGFQHGALKEGMSSLHMPLPGLCTYLIRHLAVHMHAPCDDCIYNSGDCMGTWFYTSSCSSAILKIWIL